MLHVPAVVLAAALAAGAVLAPPAVEAQSEPDAVAAALLSQFERVSGYLLTAAEQVPEDRYSYRPTDEVMSLVELLNHVADTHFSYCSAVGGGERPAVAEAEPTAKTAVVERFRESRDFCLQRYRQADGSSLGEAIGNGRTRAAVLIQNVSHDNLHYGNVVTYMREIGMVPPSSQSGG